RTVKSGEDVTIACNSTIRDKNKVFWYKQSFGKVPQFFARYQGKNSYAFANRFLDSRFGFTVNEHQFDLNIKNLREDDVGDYFCGEMELTTIKFTSGTRLQFEAEKHWILYALTTFSIISVLVIMVLVGVLFKNHRKGASSRKPEISSNQADDEDVLNYAAVSFAKKPSSSRTSRDQRHEDVYAQVRIK
ncbi:putative immune-type receptor 6b precursor, partial [Silurus asotus]